MLHITVIALYLFTLIGIGFYKANKIKNQADFSIAGRTLAPWILVGTMLATWMGTGSILGNAGKTYETGLAAMILPLGGVLGIALLTQIAGKVRSFEKYTVPEILGDRYGSVTRILSVIALVMAYLVIVSYQYNAGGAVLKTVLTDSSGHSLVSVETGTVIAAVFIIAYTMLAGLVSVAYTDVGNGIIMILTFAIAFPILLIKAGGFSGMEASFAQMGKESHMQFWGVYSSLDILNFCLPPFLLVMGDANMYQRFFASRTVKGAKSATIVLVFAVALMELLIIASAWVSSSMIPDAEVGKYVMIYASHRILPPLLGAVMMTTIVGIIISTADSFLLVPATTLMRDVYLLYINPGANDKKIVLFSRLLVLGLGLIAFMISREFEKSAGFFERALYAYTIYGAAITPSLVAALFWKRATTAGAITSIVTGTVTTLIWKEAGFIQNLVPASVYHKMDEVIPAITISVISLVVVSLLTKNKR
jgi:SSS family transporter